MVNHYFTYNVLFINGVASSLNYITILRTETAINKNKVTETGKTRAETGKTIHFYVLLDMMQEIQWDKMRCRNYQNR